MRNILNHACTEFQFSYPDEQERIFGRQLDKRNYHRTEPSVILLKKYAANCSNRVTTVRKLKLLPTHKQQHQLLVFTPGFS